MFETHKELVTYLILIFFSINTYAADSDFTRKIDSIQTLTNTCETDTCKFAILSGFFWQYFNSDFQHAKQIGLWAYDVIKNSDDKRAQSDGYDIYACIFWREGERDSAIYYFKKALKTSEEIGYKHRIAWSSYNLELLSYRSGNVNTPNRTERILHYGKIAIKYSSEIDNNYLSVQSISLVADVFEAEGILDSSIVYNKKILALQKSHSDTVGQIKTSLKISRLYQNQNKNLESVEYLKYALIIAGNLGKSDHLADVFIAIGDLFFKQKKNSEIAKTYYSNALEIIGENKPYTPYLYNQLGIIYLQEGNDSLSLECFMKTLEIGKRKKINYYISAANKGLGSRYMRLAEYNFAIQCFKISYETVTDVPAITYHEILVNLGDIYNITDDSDSSMFWYQKSLELAKKYNANNETAISKLRIGSLYHRNGEKAAAEQYFLQAIQSARKTENILLIKSLADTLSKFYSDHNDFSSAFNYMNLSKNMADSLILIDKQANMNELVLKYEFDKMIRDYQKKQEMADEKIKRQKAFTYSLVVISILLVTFGLVVFIRYRRKKKDNKLLISQNKQIEEKNTEIQLQIKELESILKKQISYNHNLSTDLSTYPDIDKIFLNKCMDVIKEHIDDAEFTVEILAEKTALSRRNLYRKLKVLTGLKPAELIRFARMQHAADLLISTSMRIQEIAMATGYENVNNFRQSFKNYHGAVPSQFLENQSK